jgi:hypothetical protein
MVLSNTIRLENLLLEFKCSNPRRWCGGVGGEAVEHLK